ncbi:hypothetical protein B0H17DRAFT_468235 [Mycena rosella]|uniref:Uncharacterized protein n=1 Tax=Mycena rosella TaxID=1033263 RepID=A0AAD7C6L4_MYCRO|nr:hypothetical protein B0H17DRAFT_468235 [Mycena rosella]
MALVGRWSTSPCPGFTWWPLRSDEPHVDDLGSSSKDFVAHPRPIPRSLQPLVRVLCRGRTVPSPRIEVIGPVHSEDAPRHTPDCRDGRRHPHHPFKIQEYRRNVHSRALFCARLAGICTVQVYDGYSCFEPRVSAASQPIIIFLSVPFGSPPPMNIVSVSHPNPSSTFVSPPSISRGAQEPQRGPGNPHAQPSHSNSSSAAYIVIDDPCCVSSFTRAVNGSTGPRNRNGRP